MADITFGDVIVRIVLAMLAGAVVGAERGRFHGPADLRTCIIIATSASMVMALDEKLLHTVYYTVEHITALPDPSRIGAQVVAGVGFLGAGTILYTRSGIRGLTTAATLWTVACLGLAFGAGLIHIGIVGTAAVFIILTVCRKLQRVIAHFAVKNPTATLSGFQLEGTQRREMLLYLRECAKVFHVKIRNLTFSSMENGKYTVYFIADFSGIISQMERGAFIRAIQQYPNVS